MKEDLISFETAKLAKEKGFDLHVTQMYDENGTRVKWGIHRNHNHWEKYTSCPTQSLLQKWLRDVHNIHTEIRVIYNSNEYSWCILHVNPYDVGDNSVIRYKTYESALEKALYESLTLIEK